MPERLILDRDQARALLLQRTTYQPRWTPVIHKLGLTTWYANTVATRTSATGRRKLAEKYLQECEAEADSLQKVIPEGSTEVMDIGCGLAGPDLVLGRRHANLRFTLVDIDSFSQRPYYGFEQKAATYNALESTKKFLVTNGIDESRVRTANVESAPLPTTERIDIVFSLISWGFHYPVETYAEQVAAILKPSGVAVLDIRNETDGVAQLQKKFAQVSEISGPSRGKSRRFVARQA